MHAARTKAQFAAFDVDCLWRDDELAFLRDAELLAAQLHLGRSGAARARDECLALQGHIAGIVIADGLFGASLGLAAVFMLQLNARLRNMHFASAEVLQTAARQGVRGLAIG